MKIVVILFIILIILEHIETGDTIRNVFLFTSTFITFTEVV